MDINYELYKVFYHVASTLSFSEASKQLFISQSAVSQSIKVLEKKLNQTLFIRSTKKVQLTPEGEILLKHVEPGGKDTGNDGYSAERNRTAAGGAACHCPERKERLSGKNADRCGLCQPACACIPDGGDPSKGRKITAPPPDGAAGARFWMLGRQKLAAGGSRVPG